MRNSNEFEPDFVFLTGGAIRLTYDIEIGPITLQDMMKCFPFGDTIVNVECSGHCVLDILENSVSTIADGDGRFMQVSGL